MKKPTYLFLLIFLVWTIGYGLSTAYADIPHLINYQGKLTDSAGKALEGSYNVTFRIYDAEAGGNLLWQEAQAINIQKGIFSVLLGGQTALNLAFDKPYFLSIQVGSDTEMTPRQRITSAGYAFRAKDADTVGNVSVSTTPAANKLLPLDANAKLPAVDGSQLTNLSSNYYSNIQVFTSSGTFIKPPGINKVFVEVVGGGGGGGTTGSYNNGSSGGNSSFGSFCSASGGSGGQSLNGGGNGGVGGSASGGDINISGQAGAQGGNVLSAGSGGSSRHGFGATTYYSNATGYGAGGAGAYYNNGGTIYVGGGGGAGGYSCKICTLTSDVAVTIGAGGAGANGGWSNGGNGSSGIIIVRW